MSITAGFLIPLCAAAAIVSVATAQKGTNQPEQLSARDMFYHPVRVASASGGTPQKTLPADKGKSGAKRAPVEVATARDKPAGQTPTSTPQTQTPPQTLPESGRIIQAAVRKPAPTEGPALGLRYTIVKKGKEDAEVATDAIFHNADQVQVRIETNQPAYLYIITQGSSGTWKVQVPSDDAPGSNRVEAMRPYYFPPRDRDGNDQAFTFHDPKGTEKLFVIASREPVPDIQDQIYGLQGGKPKPAAQPEAAPLRQAAIIEARLNIPDNKIEQMRSLYSRDLIIERVNPDTTGDKVEKKEFAMYVVNPTGSPNSRLVADISLVHQ
jgi:hypothetical protein